MLSHVGGTDLQSSLSVTEEDEKVYMKPIKSARGCQLRKSP